MLSVVDVGGYANLPIPAPQFQIAFNGNNDGEIPLGLYLGVFSVSCGVIALACCKFPGSRNAAYNLGCHLCQRTVTGIQKLHNQCMTFIRGNQATDQTRTDCAQATDGNIDKVEDPATKASDIEAINIESQAESDSDLDDSDFVFITAEREGI